MNLKKTIYVLLGIILIALPAEAQFKNSNNNAMNTGLIPLSPGDAVDIFDDHKPKLQGSLYYNDDWQKADIVLNSNKEALDYQTRYDLQNFSLEIKVDNKIYDLPGSVVRSFSLNIYEPGIGSRQVSFINPRTVETWQASDNVFLERIQTGQQYELYKSNYTKIKKPNYNVALDAGSKDPQIVRYSKYYLFDGEAYHEIPTRKKPAIEMLSQFSNQIEKRANAKKYKFKEESDFRDIVEFLNENAGVSD